MPLREALSFLLSVFIFCGFMLAILFIGGLVA